MAVDYFDSTLAIDPVSGAVVPNAVADVYAITDTGFATPLDLTDVSGSPLANLKASSTGVFPPFRVISGETQVLARTSSGIVTPMTSVFGQHGAAAQAATADAETAADSAAASAAAAAASAQQAVLAAQSAGGGGTSGSGIIGAPSVWPSTFPPSPHTHTASQISDATVIGRTVMTAATQQAARDAMGAGTGNGTSNLTIGTTSTTAAAGNHTHPASQISLAPISGMAATDVQAGIAELAARPTGTGGTGGGSTTTVDVLYSSGAYPVQAGSPPAGIKIRHFYGPVQYVGATWAGVLDLYTYAELT